MSELADRIVKYFEDRYNQKLSVDELLRVTSDGALELIKEMDKYYEAKNKEEKILGHQGES